MIDTMIGNQCIVESRLEYDDKNQEYEDDDTDGDSRTYSKFSGTVTGYSQQLLTILFRSLCNKA